MSSASLTVSAMSPLPPDVDIDQGITIPDGAFITSVQLEGTVVLETAIDNPLVIDQPDLLSAWEELSAVSVEAAVLGRPDLFEFANDHCLLFAAIRSPVKVVLPASTELAKLGLPDHDAVTWTDSPILPEDPSAVYETVNAYHAQNVTLDSTPPSAFSEPSPLASSSSQNEATAPTGDASKMVMEWKTIGIVYVTMSPLPNEVYIAVALLPTYRGKGGGMTACAFAVQWAVETIQAHRVQARIMSSPHCDRAQRLFTALGFAHEGIQRRAVADVAGAWTDVTLMGIVDTDWVMRKRTHAAPRSVWDELFQRHQREREELLRWDEFHNRARLRRTSSMETVREGADTELELELEPMSESEQISDCAETRSPSPARSASSSRSLVSVGAEQRDLELGGWRSPRAASSDSSDAGDPFSDSEWAFSFSSSQSDVSRFSEEPFTRPQSAQSASSWSSFERIDSS